MSPVSRRGLPRFAKKVRGKRSHGRQAAHRSRDDLANQSSAYDCDLEMATSLVIKDRIPNIPQLSLHSASLAK